MRKWHVVATDTLDFSDRFIANLSLRISVKWFWKWNDIEWSYQVSKIGSSFGTLNYKLCTASGRRRLVLIFVVCITIGVGYPERFSFPYQLGRNI